MRRQFFVVDQGRSKSPRYVVKLVMGYTPEQKRPKRIVSPGYLTKRTADEHASELNRKGSRGIMKKIATEIEVLFEMLEEGESPRVGNALTRIAEYKLGRRKANYKVQDRIKDRSKVIDWIIATTDHPDTDWLWEILNEGYSDEPRKLYSMFYDYIVSRKIDVLTEDLKSYDGVILFSGGLDSVAVGMVLAQDKKKKYLPVYISHRSNVGNVTKKEILAARKLAKKIFDEELMVIKPDAKGKLPVWYGKRVYVTDHMPVPKTKKNERNRRFLKVLKEYGLADKEIWLGVLGIPGAGDRSRAAGRAQDVTKEGLQKHLKKIGGKGKIKVVRDIKGVKTKADLLRKLPKNFKPDIIESQSCLMYFNKPCGDCWSCMERVESIMQVYGKDQTPYRKDSKADKYKKKTDKDLLEIFLDFTSSTKRHNPYVSKLYKLYLGTDKDNKKNRNKFKFLLDALCNFQILKVLDGVTYRPVNIRKIDLDGFFRVSSSSNFNYGPALERYRKAVREGKFPRLSSIRRLK